MASATAEKPARRTWWSRPPLLWIRRTYLLFLNWLLSRLYRFVRSHYRLWYRSSQRYSPFMDRLAYLYAYSCARGRRSATCIP